MKAIRLLHINAGNAFGGIETLLLTLARLQSTEADLYHEFALCFDGRLVRALDVEKAKIHRLGPVRVSRPWTVQKARRRLNQLLDDSKWDAVVCHSSWCHVIAASAVRKAKGPALVSWVHCPSSGRHWLERWARRTMPDYAIAVSADTQASIARLFPGVPSSVVYAPLPLNPADYRGVDATVVRRSMGVPDGRTVIIQVSRMEEGKGHRVHIDALARLADSKHWHCWLVGGAATAAEMRYEADLRHQVRRHGLESRIQFLGARSDVPRLLQAADIFCHPNIRREGLGIVFVEAAYAGLPVVTTDIGGGAELLGADGATLCPVGNPSALAESLNRLIENPSVRRETAARGRDRVLDICDPGPQLQRLRSALLRAIESAKGPLASTPIAL